MHTARCVVSFTDSDNIQHEVEVWANTVYDAVAQAVNEFCRGDLASGAPRSQHRAVRRRTSGVRDAQVEAAAGARWAEGGGKNPRTFWNENRIRDLLARHVKP